MGSDRTPSVRQADCLGSKSAAAAEPTIGTRERVRQSDIDYVEAAHSSELGKVPAVARNAGTCSAQCAFNDAGINNALWRNRQQDTGGLGGLVAEVFDFAALDELAQPVLASAAAPDLR